MMIRKIAQFCTALAALLACSPPSAHATGDASSCGSRDGILAHLQSLYREAPVAMGLANNGGVIEVMRSRDGGTFTIVITMPNGTSCMIAAGERWEELPKTLVRAPRI